MIVHDFNMISHKSLIFSADQLFFFNEKILIKLTKVYEINIKFLN